MSEPDPVNILSDEEEEEEEGKYYKSKDNAGPRSQFDAVCIDLSTPSPNFSKKKKQRLLDPSVSNPSLSISSAPVFIIDDDISVVAAETTPLISSHVSKPEDVSIIKTSYGSSGAESTPSVVAETPISELLAKSELPIVRCNRGDSNSQPLAPSLFSDRSSPSESRLICLHSDKETERELEAQVSDETTGFIVDVAEKIEFSSRFVGSASSSGGKSELLSKCKVPIVRCNHLGDSSSQPSAASLFSYCSSPESKLKCLHSDKESERGLEGQGSDETTGSIVDVAEGFDYSSRFFDSASSFGKVNETHVSVISSPHPDSLEDDLYQVHGTFDDESDRMEHIDEVFESKSKNKDKAISEKGLDNLIGKGRISKEERLRLKKEQKQQKEQEKLEKAAQKAEVAELKKLQKERHKFNLQQARLEKAAQKAEAAEWKKLQKEKHKWEKGKFAQKSIVAQIDSKIVEMGSIAGHLLTRFGENGLSYRVKSNPMERSIVWTMTVPEELSKISCGGVVIPYVLLIYEAEEFCNLVMSGTLMDQVSRIQNHYPNHTICYLINRLMAYINKREQGQYRNPGKYEGWKRPPIEEVLAKLATHFVRVHSRLCVDEAELAEHVVGLTHSLASCQYRKKPTPLSVNANGSVVPKDCPDRNLIKKNTWLKALVAIPKVQPRFAIAIWKKYPTMKSLLSVYMDPSKSVHEKEFLLKDLTTEGLIGDDRRLGEICSKRVYRILMAQCGTIITDDVEHGADYFHHQTF